MAQTITFSSAFIRTAAFALDEGTKRIRINVTASLTKEVRDKMDWQELERPKSFKGRLIEEAGSEDTRLKAIYDIVTRELAEPGVKESTSMLMRIADICEGRAAIESEEPDK